MQLKVLIVDDSAVARKLLSETIAADPTMKVIGSVGDGHSAVRSIKELAPDIITLDVEMPGISGIETVKEIRKLDPRIPIIMFSALTEIGSKATLEALTAGASDYVTKPTGSANLTESKERITKDLLTKIKALCKKNSVNTQPSKQIKPTLTLRTKRPKATQIQIIAIGSSTGGPNALMQVITQLPQNFPLPVLVTQHMPPVFTSSLAARLSQQAKLPVVEAADGMEVVGGKVFIAPGDFHLEVKRKQDKIVIHTHKGAQENSCRPAVDVMFRSLPYVYGGKVLATVLTGMGQDGMLGAKFLTDYGATVIAQDEQTSVVWGMPGAVVSEGLADFVLPLSGIAPEILRLTSRTSIPNRGRV